MVHCAVNCSKRLLWLLLGWPEGEAKQPESAISSLMWRLLNEDVWTDLIRMNISICYGRLHCLPFTVCRQFCHRSGTIWTKNAAVWFPRPWLPVHPTRDGTGKITDPLKDPWNSNLFSQKSIGVSIISCPFWCGGLLNKPFTHNYWKLL